MKRFILFPVLAVVMASYTFAENAKALSAWSGEFYVTPGVSFFSKAWDDDGKRTDMPKTEIFYLGLGLTYGFTDWFSAAFDWKGWNIWSDGGGPAEAFEGFHDFSLEGQFHLMGENAPIALLKTSRFRLTAAPGIVFPFPLIDDDDKMGKNAWGFGGSVSFDTVINKYFFLNAFGKFYLYPIENEEKVKHGWDLTLEAEPNFNIDIRRGMNLSAGLPVNLNLGPEQKIDGAGNGMNYYAVSLRPTVTLRITNPPVPVMEMGIDYAVPLVGKNAVADHAITLKTSVFF